MEPSELLAYSDENIRLMKSSLYGELRKNVTLSTGLVAYDLQAPAKNLYPIITPLRNSMPRVRRPNPGDAARWRTISSITGSGYDAMGWVPEGQRSASMSYSATPATAPYVTMGEEDTVTFEAEAAAEGFEDINATATLRLLQKTMRKEEMAILGGNYSLSLAAPTISATSASGTGSAIAGSGTLSIYVVALTFEGWKNSSIPGGVATSRTITGNDGNTYTLSGGSSNKSAQATQAYTAGQYVYATVTASSIPAGTFAFAWYWGAAGSEKLGAITTINSVQISTNAGSGSQAPTAITSNNSTNLLAFDGLLVVGSNPANGNQANGSWIVMPDGPPGTGTFLTASGRGSVVEIDNMLVAMWNNYRLSPTVIYVNAQEQRNITSKCLTNSSGPLVRYNIPVQEGQGRQPYEFSASGVVRWYYNPFSVDTGQDIPIKVHPDLPPGTLLAICERLPIWYQDNNVENPLALMMRRDYYRVDWPLRTRRREYGVYTEETLAAYAPFAVGGITNIGNG